MQQVFPRSDTDDVDPVAAYHDVDRPAPVGRPWVLVNMVASVDGATAVDGRSGPLGGEADRRLLGVLRGLADVVLVGAGTVRAEGYGPPRTPVAEVGERRADRGQAVRPRLAVVSGRADLDPSASLFADRDPDDPPPLVYTSTDVPPDRLVGLYGVAEVVATDGAPEVAAVVADLHDRGVGIVLCEGGPSLVAQLSSAGLVDELCLSVSPLIVGSGSGLLAGAPLPTPTSLRLAHVLTADDFLFCRYLTC
ncbi:MAG: pyrimidine reductase family protein [Acidimicrobiales bacterium]|nr:pyrimidine reductase family protein [Acidimicrobiales bacterium]